MCVDKRMTQDWSSLHCCCSIFLWTRSSHSSPMFTLLAILSLFTVPSYKMITKMLETFAVVSVVCNRIPSYMQQLFVHRSFLPVLFAFLCSLHFQSNGANAAMILIWRKALWNHLYRTEQIQHNAKLTPQQRKNSHYWMIVQWKWNVNLLLAPTAYRRSGNFHR